MRLQVVFLDRIEHIIEKNLVRPRLITRMVRFFVAAARDVGNHNARFFPYHIRPRPLFEFNDDEVGIALHIVSCHDEVHPPACRRQPVFNKHAAVTRDLGAFKHAFHENQRVFPGTVLCRTARGGLMTGACEHVGDNACGLIFIKFSESFLINDRHERTAFLSSLYLAEDP